MEKYQKINPVITYGYVDDYLKGAAVGPKNDLKEYPWL